MLYRSPRPIDAPPELVSGPASDPTFSPDAAAPGDPSVMDPALFHAIVATGQHVDEILPPGNIWPRWRPRALVTSRTDVVTLPGGLSVQRVRRIIRTARPGDPGWPS